MSRIGRLDEEFKKELLDIKIKRLQMGIDKELKSDRRLTKAIVRASDWQRIKNTLIVSELKDDRKFKRKR